MKLGFFILNTNDNTRLSALRQGSEKVRQVAGRSQVEMRAARTPTNSNHRSIQGKTPPPLSSPMCLKSTLKTDSEVLEKLFQLAGPHPKVTFLQQPPVPSLSRRGSLCPTEANQRRPGHPSGIRPQLNVLQAQT